VLREFDSDGTDAALLASSLQTFVDSCHKFAGFETMEEYYEAINPNADDLLGKVKVCSL
jgi:hypothetical protein